MELRIEMFKTEIAQALATYDKCVICLDKPNEECEASLIRLMEKAMSAYLDRAPGLRHGIALDRQLTIILSQSESEIPLCGIYFNLHSPYQKNKKRLDKKE